MYFSKSDEKIANSNPVEYKDTLVIVAADSEGKDISTLILEYGIGCPDKCDYTS